MRKSERRRATCTLELVADASNNALDTSIHELRIINGDGKEYSKRMMNDKVKL